jgi:hypothetical protein
MLRKLVRAGSVLAVAAASGSIVPQPWSVPHAAGATPESPPWVKVDHLRSVVSPVPSNRGNRGGRLVLGLRDRPIDQLNAVSACVGEPLFTTNSHQQVMEALVHQASFLQANKFKGSNGAHARLLHGPKGIGKTHMLRTFTAVCQEAFPDIIPVYITFNEKSERDNVLRSHDIMQVVAQQLAKHGIAVQADADTSVSVAVIEALEASGKKLLLLVDEIDQLYRVNSHDVEYDAARSSLSNLAFIGDRGNTGVISAVICGSSAVCPFLTTANASEDWMRSEFPLVMGAPNLNGQKYRVWRVSAPLPNDIESVRNVLTARGGHDASLAEARMAAFVGGGAARDVAKVSDQQLAAVGLDTKFADDKETALRKLEAPGGRLYKALVLALREKNKQLIAALTTDEYVDPRKVTDCQWDALVNPLPWSEVVECWSSLPHADKGAAKDMSKLQGELLGMCDSGWLMFDRIRDGQPANVYPACCGQLFSLHDGPEQKQKWDERLAEVVKEADWEVGVTVSVPPRTFMRSRPRQP